MNRTEFAPPKAEKLTVPQQPIDRSKCCPSCGRVFDSVLDYPAVRVGAFEQLPPPEVVDQLSTRVFGRKEFRQEGNRSETVRYRVEGPNVTPAIVDACQRDDVLAYFSQLQATVGQVVRPNEGLRPNWPAHKRFRGVHPLSESPFYLGLSEAIAESGGIRVVDVAIYTNGPNLGSAGGPTIQNLGSIARIRYEGLLLEDTNHN